MIINMPTIQIPSDYIPEIIGIIGTILGTILGWLLSLISNSIGKSYIYSDNFDEQKSSNNEYAYVAKLFIYNNSAKQQCMRNIRFSFAKHRWKVLFESIPGEGKCDFNTVRTQSKNKVGMIVVSSYAQGEYFLSDLISGENFSNLLKVRKVYLIYEDKKNNTKKKLVKKNFNIASVEKAKSHSFL